MNAVRACFDWVKRHWTWLKWPVALTILAVLFYQHREGFSDLRERKIQWHFLLLGLALCAGSIALTFVRWFFLVWAQEIPFRIRDAMRLGFIGFLFNYVGPGGAGGDVAKALMIAREHPTQRAVAVATIALDRILGLLSLFLVGAMATSIPTVLVQKVAFRPVTIIYWAGAIGGVVGLALLMHPTVPRSRWLNRLIHLRYVGKIIGALIDGVLMYQTKRRILIGSVFIGIVGHFGMLSAFYFFARALHPETSIPGYWAHLQMVPAAELAGVMIFFLPGGVGALEGALDYFYIMAGAPNHTGFLTAIAYRSMTIVIAAVGAGYYLTARKEINEALDESHLSSEVQNDVTGSAVDSESSLDVK